MRRKRALFIIFSFVYLIITVVMPLSSGKAEYSTSTSYDFFQHGLGAKQLIQNKALEYENDLRKIFGKDNVLEYPPGYMIFIAALSAITGIEIFDTALAIVVVNCVLFLLLLYIFTLSLIKDKKDFFYPATAIILGLCFISGDRMLGVHFAAPPILGAFLIWTALILLLREHTKAHTKIILVSALLTTLFITHRPSSIAWMLILGTILFSSLLRRDMRLFLLSFYTTLIALNIAYVLYFRFLFQYGVFETFLYRIVPLQAGEGHSAVLSAIVLANFIILFLPLIFKIDFESALTRTMPRANLKKRYVLVGLFATTIGFAILLFPWIQSSVRAIRESSFSNPLTVARYVYDILDSGQFSLVRSISYIFHIGFIPVLFFLVSLWVLRKNRTVLFYGMISLALILITFVGNHFIVLYDKPERIFIYVTLTITCISALGIAHLLRYSVSSRWGFFAFTAIVALNLIFSGVINSTKEVYPEKVSYYSFNFVKENFNDTPIFSSSQDVMLGRAITLNKVMIEQDLPRAMDRYASLQEIVLYFPQETTEEHVLKDRLENHPEIDVVYANGERTVGVRT